MPPGCRSGPINWHWHRQPACSRECSAVQVSLCMRPRSAATSGPALSPLSRQGRSAPHACMWCTLPPLCRLERHKLPPRSTSPQHDGLHGMPVVHAQQGWAIQAVVVRRHALIGCTHVWRWCALKTIRCLCIIPLCLRRHGQDNCGGGVHPSGGQETSAVCMPPSLPSCWMPCWQRASKPRGREGRGGGETS